jgi:hypothetical protein
VMRKKVQNYTYLIEAPGLRKAINTRLSASTAC